MGLGIYLGDERVGQWSYSGFFAFRKRLAEAAGIDLSKMEGYFAFDMEQAIRSGDWNLKLLEDKKCSKIAWSTIADPIVPLLSHSDSEGIIPPEVCATVAPRLRELIKDWPKTVTIRPTKEWVNQGYAEEMTFPEHDKVQGDSLADGMEEAAKQGKRLEFH